MIVEGVNSACEILKSGYPIEKIIISAERTEKIDEILSLAKMKNVEVERVSKQEIDKITKSQHHQGVISFVKPYKYFHLTDILNDANEKNEPPFILILDSISDPHNLGALIRTAECLGVHGVIIPQNRACEVNETVFKTSAGAIAKMKVAQVVNLSQTIEKLKKQNIWCYALEAGEQDISSTDLTGAIALVVGSEGKGVSRLVRKTCDATISIALKGVINSLNASNAGAIAMYEVLRQHNTKR